MVESKQVKVDNWGIFFLQRLQKFYTKNTFCDLTLQFEDSTQIKVHRLVLNACTEFFQMIEKKCPAEQDVLMMPSNLSSDIILSIVNFMYSGILEFREATFDKLYATAKLMNMSVLTKLMDAQKTPMKPVTPVQRRVQSVTPIAWNLQNKRFGTKHYVETELPETLPGRKLPIWKRKSVPTSVPFLSSNNYESFSPKIIKPSSDEPPKPTRFDWPEEESSFENSFDDISYESKPLILPTFTPEKSPKPSTSTFEEIKKTALPVKRSASPLGNQCKKVNIQDVKEYLKEQKIRTDYIDYDDSEMADNDLQTFDNEDSNEEQKGEINSDETPSKSILKNESGSSHVNKHVRFSLEGKENSEKKVTKAPQNADDMSKHTKIITEVLKKYPHLVKNNKNIRLKILAKGNNMKTPQKSPTPQKQESKVSYMVVKPENQKTKPEKDQIWECTRCEPPQKYTTYHTYRQHLTDAHNEKEDSQMCKICGHKSQKLNMIAYHKFVKHNIPPPAMYTFPKCASCPYIAPSQILLQKHIATHALTNLTCNECKTVFPNKTTLASHLQTTGHTQERNNPQFSCKHCPESFFSENILKAHMKRNHEELEPEIKPDTSKTKEKIKIISDVKVENQIPNTFQVKDTNQNSEPSSEAEALSNVASGIAASLGLVDTIVVLDENQFILQSQPNETEFILPDMQIATSSMNTITTSDANTVLTQSMHKTGITSTDELVMVLTDHDYGDGTNNAVITDNNIVVLYSHPVQTQAGTMMITSDAGMIEVDKNYAQNIPVTLSEQTTHCEESIEMIQQEINNQLDTAVIQNEQQIIEINETQNNEMRQQYEVQMQEIKNDDTDKELVNYENTNLQVIETDAQITTNEVKTIEDGILQVEENLISEENKLEIQENITENTQIDENVIQMEDNVTEIDQNQMQIEESQPMEEGVEEIEENQMQTDDNQLQMVENQMQLVENQIQLEENQIQLEENESEMIETQQIDENQTQIQENLIEMQESEVQMEENVPQIEENIEQFEENIIQTEESTESITQKENLIELQQINENLGENIPQIQENLQQIEENLPQIEDNVENIPQDQDNLHQIEENVDNFIKIEENLVQVQENVHEIENNQEDMPQIEDNEENILQNEDNVLQNEDNIQQIQENVVEVDQNIHKDEIRTVKAELKLEEPLDIEEIQQKEEILNQKDMEIVEEHLTSETDITGKLDPETSEELIEENSDNCRYIVEASSQEEYINEQQQNTEENLEKTDDLELKEDNINETDTLTQTENVEIENKVEANSDFKNTRAEISEVVRNERISNILEDWDDVDSDSPQSFSKPQTQEVKTSSSINNLIGDWDEEEES